MTFLFLAAETTAKDLRENQGNLVFCGVFLLSMLGVAIWWLRKG
ncbi:MAG TPA: hypothetical protein VFE58_18250 [Tepidisphaeraceae bacterium]|jgi:hypothetical protein|nr:hypothetical protein [Tepidisphaeraceae bacterium]